LISPKIRGLADGVGVGWGVGIGSGVGVGDGEGVSVGWGSGVVTGDAVAKAVGTAVGSAVGCTALGEAEELEDAEGLGVITPAPGAWQATSRLRLTSVLAIAPGRLFFPDFT